MTTGMVVGLIGAALCLVLLWPVLRQQGSGAFPAVLIWLLLIAAVAGAFLLLDHFGIHIGPDRELLREVPQPQRGVAT